MSVKGFAYLHNNARRNGDRQVHRVYSEKVIIKSNSQYYAIVSLHDHWRALQWDELAARAH